MRFPALGLALLLAGASLAPAQTTDDPSFPIKSNLKAGAAKADITPPAGTKAIGHTRPTTGIRDAIEASILLLDDGKTRAAICAFDLIDANKQMTDDVRKVVSEAASIPPQNILVTASHNHSGPDYDTEPAWAKQMLEKVSEAAARASSDMRPVSVGYGVDRINFSINRRKVINGQAVVRLNPDGPNDPRVKVLRFDDGKSLTPVSVLMHALCHPCFFTWGDNATAPYAEGYPNLTADFPGEARRFVEKIYDSKTVPLFLQGCSGDIRPNLAGAPYRCADEADIQYAGLDLGGATVRALGRAATREERSKRPEHYTLKVASRTVELPGKHSPVTGEFMAMKIGPYLILTMPGEPMVEMGLRMERVIEDRAIPIVMGYSNGGVGYINTAASYAVGGYEPESSPLAPESEEAIYKVLDELTDEVIGDVFRTFSKHPKEIEEKRLKGIQISR